MDKTEIKRYLSNHFFKILSRTVFLLASEQNTWPTRFRFIFPTLQMDLLSYCDLYFHYTYLIRPGTAFTSRPFIFATSIGHDLFSSRDSQQLLKNDEIIRRRQKIIILWTFKGWTKIFVGLMEQLIYISIQIATI